MNKATYYNFIEERIVTLSVRIATRGRFNILDYHLHSENFYRDLLNKLYNWELENLNSTIQNVEAIDLIDRQRKISIQVSATNTKSKIDHTLLNIDSKAYKGFNFKFMSIAHKANSLREKNYTVPEGISFNPLQDIYDYFSILNVIKDLTIEKIENIHELIKKELGFSNVDRSRIETNLGTIINLLAKENLNHIISEASLDAFEIDKKIDFNNLTVARFIIEDYKIYYGVIDKMYAEFDKLGANKSLSVLQCIRYEYLKNKAKLDGDELFSLIISNIEKRILDDPNSSHIPPEEVAICVGIVIVDAFIRCKIFENPVNYNYVTT